VQREEILKSGNKRHKKTPTFSKEIFVFVFGKADRVKRGWGLHPTLSGAVSKKVWMDGLVRHQKRVNCKGKMNTAGESTGGA